MSQSKDLDLTFADLKREIEGLFVNDGWVTVFRSHYSDASGESDAVYCALVKNSAVSDAMRSHRWNLQLGSVDRASSSPFAGVDRKPSIAGTAIRSMRLSFIGETTLEMRKGT